MPVLAVVRVCRIRTFRDRYVYLDWLQLFCAGETTMCTAW